MNINLEKLYAEMKDRPWNKGIPSLLATLRSKDLTGNFPIPFVKVKTNKKCGVAQLPLEDFTIFGIDPKNDSFDLVHCSKCKLLYRLQNVGQHMKQHNRIARSIATDSPESFSSNSLPSTPTKAAKKEMPKMTKKYVLSPPEIIPSTDVSSDPDVSSSGDVSYPSDGSNISNNGLVKTELDAIVPINTQPVNFTTSIKSKHILLDKLKKQNNRDNIKDSRKAVPPTKLKEYDPNKHCGVCTEENGWSPCLRSLTCKSHLISLRRAVPGRCKSFDELLLDHKQSKGSKTLSSISLANKLAKKKPKETTAVTSPHPVITSHPISIPHVQVTMPHVQVAVPRIPSPLPIMHRDLGVIKEEPMLVDETPEEPLLPKYELEELPYTPLPVVECTTRVRRSTQAPQPMALNTRSVCLSENRMFTTATEAYWMKLLSSNVIQSTGLQNTININSIKKTLYPAQFFNLMGSSDTTQNNGTSFIPLNHGRFKFTGRGLNECKTQHDTIVKNMSLLDNFS